MGWCDEALGFPDPSGGEDSACPPQTEIDARLAAFPVEDLVRAWRESSTTSLKDQTAGTHAFRMYFDGLAHDDPERAVAFVEAELAGEPDDAMVALVAEGKLLGQLLHFHGPRVATALQSLALRQPRLRWLLGAAALSIEGGLVESAEAKRRLLAIADEAAYRTWREHYRADAETIDFASLSVAELASLWVEVMNRSDVEKERDDNWSDLFDFQNELVSNDPLEALELVKAILAIEDNPNVLGLLAAGMLEDLIPADDGPVIDAVVDEASRNEKFRRLLGGVWFYGMSPKVAERLEQARGEVRW
ncbi:MAG: hypothetical protein R3D30_12100 [Hyphomicrobiales bacterium]